MTGQELRMADDLLAIGFPPNKVSVQGILMTNPGQVDPGYQGPLRFTVINMSRKCYCLRRGDPIVSLIFVRLSNPAHKDWLTRHSGEKGGPPTWDNLNRVSSDFVNVEERAQRIADQSVQRADVKIKTLQIWVPVGVTLLTILATIIGSLIQASWKESLQKVQQDIAVLQSEKDVNQINKQIQDLQGQLKALQQKLPESPTSSKH